MLTYVEAQIRFFRLPVLGQSFLHSLSQDHFFLAPAKRLRINSASCNLLHLCGCSSVVEHHVANVRVVSSNLITR